MKKIIFPQSILIIGLIALIYCISTVFPQRKIENELILKTKELLNEQIYYLSNDTELLNNYLEYDIFQSGKRYYVVLTTISDGELIYLFELYDDTIYYIQGYGDYSSTKIIGSGKFIINEVHQPDYYDNNNLRITKSLDYEAVCQSVINNYYENDYYTVYLLNSFPWDKSNYLNGSEQINVMIIDKNKNVFVTYCYFSANGWNVGTPGFKFNQNEYPELVEKYKDTAVYSKSAIGTIFDDIDKYKLEIRATDTFSGEAYIVPVNAANDEYNIDCTITNLTSDELSVNLSEQYFLCYSSNMTNPTAYGNIEEFTFKPNEQKEFSFNVDSVLLGEKDDKVIYGSCVLEVTNSDKYDYFNVLKAEPYIIERNKNEKNN